MRTRISYYLLWNQTVFKNYFNIQGSDLLYFQIFFGLLTKKK